MLCDDSDDNLESGVADAGSSNFCDVCPLQDLGAELEEEDVYDGASSGVGAEDVYNGLQEGSGSPHVTVQDQHQDQVS